MNTMTHRYNAAMNKILGRMPERMKQLPVTEEGWPQLWFAGITKDGKPDLRCADSAKRMQAVMQNKCWLCGGELGVWKVFVIGPMCAITRTTSEPPCHRECAEFATIACPFLSKPRMQRNELDMPDGYKPPPGIAIMRNPGAIVLWVCKEFEIFVTRNGEWLIKIGHPREVLWYAEGRQASRKQVVVSIESGYPLLEAEAIKDGPDAVKDLERQRKDCERFLPA